MPLPIFLYEILKIALGWSRRCGLDRYTLGVSVGIIGNSDSDSGHLCLSLCERLFGGRALDGYSVVQIQSPFLPSSSWLEADRNWSDTSSNSPTAEFCETPYFYRPESTSLPVDAGSRGNVC